MPQKSESPVSVGQIDAMIHTIRGVRVMLDRDLAKIYGVPTFRFNEAIKRNPTSVPNRFHVSAYPRGVRFFDIADCDVKAGELIAKCDVKNWARWSAHSALCVY